MCCIASRKAGRTNTAYSKARPYRVELSRRLRSVRQLRSGGHIVCSVPGDGSQAIVKEGRRARKF
jgi:hypothetical protein